VGHHDALWRGLSTGMLDAVGTDHCPFTMEQKRMGKDNFTLIPNGAAGIEDRLQMMYTYGVAKDDFDLQRMVALGSTNRGDDLRPLSAQGHDRDRRRRRPRDLRPVANGTRSAKTHHSKPTAASSKASSVRGSRRT
jgi:dihydropyrimidinase